MRLAVIGAGGLGGYFGGRLAAAGHDVTFVVRGAARDALATNGLRLVGETVLHVPRVAATDDAAAVGAVDAVLLTTKANQLSDAVAHLGPLVGDHTGVLPLQNGIEAPGIVAEAVGEAAVLPSVVRIFTKQEGPGVVRHMGGPGTLMVAEWDNRPSPRVEALRSAFAEAGVGVPEPRDIWVEMWNKFAFVVPFGGLGAATGQPIGVLTGRLRHLLAAAVREVADVGRASGVALPADLVERTLAFADEMPPASTSSLQRDLLEGRPSELDAQLGAVVRLGHATRVPTPLHELMYEALLAREQRAGLR